MMSSGLIFFRMSSEWGLFHGCCPDFVLALYLLLSLWNRTTKGFVSVSRHDKNLRIIWGLEASH